MWCDMHAQLRCDCLFLLNCPGSTSLPRAQSINTQRTACIRSLEPAPPRERWLALALPAQHTEDHLAALI